MRPHVRVPLRAVSWGAAASAAAAAAVALVPGHAAPAAREQRAPDPATGVRLDAQVTPARPAVSPHTYTVRSGDTLGAISARFCGTSADYPSLAAASHIADANEIIPGEIVRLACHAAARVLSRSVRQPRASTAVVSASGVFSCSALEALWREAGGRSSAEFMAAEIAQAESGGRASAVSPTDDFGLWQINGTHGSLATLNPLGNARAAVLISDDGRNWNPWTTFRTGAFAGRC